MTLLDFVDRFIPEAMKNDIEMSTRSRIIVGSGFVFAIFISLNAFRGFLVGNVIMGIAIGIGGLLMLATVFALKISNSVTIAANVFVMVFSLTVYAVIYLNGGPNSEIQYNVVFIIVLGFLFCGIRVGLFWGILASLYIIVSHIINLNGYQFPAVQEESVFINLSILFGGVIALIAVYELSGNINLKKLRVEKEMSEQNAQNVQKMLEDVKIVMSRLSEGDLSKRIQVEIEGDLADLKKCVNDALEMLGQTIERVKEASREIDSGTSQVSSASQSLANGTTEQAASLEEVASSMGEIEGKARSNSENANKSSSLSSKVARKADQGNRQMEEMLTSMKRINETSAEVSKVIKVIDDIAFQTNLLALNAAVEAARAGKYGKGFAVVAEEVRNLASRSSEAAKNTTELIENSIREVEVGVKNADQTAAILKEFIVGIEEVNQIIKHISDTSEEQASGVEEINKNLGHVNHVVQQNSSISEETASASEELSSQADLLLSLMNRFNIDQKGSPVMIRAGRTAGLLEE